MPADLRLLATSRPDGGCHVSTSSLDGESNLKIKKGPEVTLGCTTPEALATRVALVDEFERLSAAFAVGDKVVVEGLKAKPKYNGKTAVVRGRVNARGRFPVTVEMRDGPETIALKLANLRAADE